MNIVQRDSIKRKLTALTEGPSPLFHHVQFNGDLISVHVQPWGNPVVMGWSQAEAFLRPLPIQVPVLRKPMGREQSQQSKHRRKRA